MEQQEGVIRLLKIWSGQNVKIVFNYFKSLYLNNLFDLKSQLQGRTHVDFYLGAGFCLLCPFLQRTHYKERDN